MGEAKVGWPQRYRLLAFLLVVVLFTAVGCVDAEPEVATPGGAPQPQVTGPTKTPFVLPTLYPTQTRPGAPSTATLPPIATATAGPTIDLTQKVVELRYAIPALGLERRLEGDVSGTITLVDEATGLAAILRNQGGVLLELQQALPDLELEEVPESCERCVHFSYSLPLDGLEEEGWLQDPVMLASVENYMTTTLGPHYPEDTVVGLHRSPSPYDVAHTLALTADGTLWRWLATSGEIAEPEPVAELEEELLSLIQQIPRDDLADEYVVTCPGAPVEQLLINPVAAPVAVEDGAAGEAAPEAPTTEGVDVAIVCPSFSLPLSLLPLYARLDTLLADFVAEEGIPRPPQQIPLTTLIAYQREDGASLLLLQSGEVRAVAPGGEVYTSTLATSEVTSLTADLRENEGLESGVEAYAEGAAPNSLLVRGEEGMMEAVWVAAPPEPLEEPVAVLDLLLAELIGAEPEVTGTPAASGTITTTIVVTATATPATATVTVAPTPTTTP